MNKNDPVKQEITNVRRNYTRTPNILFDSYPDLRPQEKWLYINLVYLCGPKGTRHLSLRYIHDRTGISLGALSGSKDPEKNNPGMILHLHTSGLIHAEIKKKKQKDGKESDQAQYHITIVDIWQLNESFFHECSEYEHLEEGTASGVQNMNATVQNMNTFSGERSENERERSENDTNIRLHSKTTDSKITEQESNTPTSSQPEHVASDDASSSSLFDLIKNATPEERSTILEMLQPSTPEPSVSVQTPPEKPSREKKGASPLTLKGKHIMEMWTAETGRKLTLNAANIKAANGLGDVVEKDEDFQDVYKMIKAHPFYTQNNVRIDLDFLFRKYDGFIGKIDDFRREVKKQQQQAEQKKQSNEPRQLTDLEKRNREMRAKYGQKASGQ